MVSLRKFYLVSPNVAKDFLNCCQYFGETSECFLVINRPSVDMAVLQTALFYLIIYVSHHFWKYLQITVSPKP